MEITPENKAQLQYIGQYGLVKIAYGFHLTEVKCKLIGIDGYGKILVKPFDIYGNEWDSPILTCEKFNEFKLLLRPLSAITEEQMKKCLQLLGYTGFKDVKYDGGFIVWQQKLQYSYTTKSLLLDHRMPAIVYQFLVDEGFDTKKYLLSGTLHEAGLAKYPNEI